jgi:cell division protein ZipA
MDLQGALLLIGLVIIVAVAARSYDKLRLSRREQHRKARQAQTNRLNLAENAENGSAAIGGASAAPWLDINPGPPVDLEKRAIKFAVLDTDAATNRDSPIYRELESVERVASKPLRLRPGARDNRRSASKEQDALDFESLFPMGHESGPNPNIDLIGYLPGSGPVMRDRALGIYRQNEYVLEKPRQLCGLSYLVGQWTILERDADDAQYSDLALAVQLADASGPIDESELNRFVQLGLKLADSFGRPLKLSLTVEQALERARQMQDFAEKYDVIASVNVVAEGGTGFNGRAIAKAAKQQGMDFGAMNIYHMKNDKGRGCRHLFSMANLYQPGAFDPETLDSFTTPGLTLFMTVPCVNEPPRAFEYMVHTAKGLCQRLGGKLTDQDQQPLSEEGLAAIERQIKRIAADINSHGISPGSENALRFFSP